MRAPIVVVDRRQKFDCVIDVDSCGDPAAGETDAVANEEISIVGGDVVQVEIGVERTGDSA